MVDAGRVAVTGLGVLTGYGRGLATVGRDVIREVARDLMLCDASGDSEAARRTDSGKQSGRRGWLGLRRRNP